MLLTIDIGNSSINFGMFCNDFLMKTFRISSNKEKTIDSYKNEIKAYIRDFHFQAAVIGSVVVELSDVIKKVIDSLCGVDSYIVEDFSNLGFELKLDNPKNAGVDRIANIVAARKLYKTPSIIVDAGTATTIDVIDKEGNFIGGAILPGFKTQLKSLSNCTSKLPEIEMNTDFNSIGKNTSEAMLSGVMQGHSYSIKGLIDNYSEELKLKPYVILTGGCCLYLQKYIQKSFNQINLNLTLQGLKIIYENRFGIVVDVDEDVHDPEI